MLIILTLYVFMHFYLFAFNRIFTYVQSEKNYKIQCCIYVNVRKKNVTRFFDKRKNAFICSNHAFV